MLFYFRLLSKFWFFSCFQLKLSLIAPPYGSVGMVKLFSFGLWSVFALTQFFGFGPPIVEGVCIFVISDTVGKSDSRLVLSYRPGKWSSVPFVPYCSGVIRLGWNVCSLNVSTSYHLCYLRRYGTPKIGCKFLPVVEIFLLPKTSRSELRSRCFPSELNLTVGACDAFVVCAICSSRNRAGCGSLIYKPDPKLAVCWNSPILVHLFFWKWFYVFSSLSFFMF